MGHMLLHCFFPLNSRPWKEIFSEYVIYQVIKPSYTSTNLKILMKISPLHFEIQGLDRSFKKILKKQRKNIHKIYSPSGKFAE